MNKTWSFFDPETGAIDRRQFSASATAGDRALKANTPVGLVAIEGAYDPLSQRVDLETRTVVDYQPPPPDDTHEWNPTLRRWVKRRDAAAREGRAQVARARIDELERAQARPIRELRLNPENAEAQRRLEEIDAQIAALRADL